MVRLATEEDLPNILELEKRYFSDETHKPELLEAYQYILERGKIHLNYRSARLTGMLALIPVNNMDDGILSLPEGSPFRERYRRGYFNSYSGYQHVHAFLMRKPSFDLIDIFREMERGMGFVFETDEDILRFYESPKIGCKRAGLVENVHVQGTHDVVLTYSSE